MARIIASGSSRLRTRAVLDADMNGSTIAIRPRAASSVTARAQASRVATRARVVEVDAGEHLAAVEAALRDLLRRCSR